jgi:hypothetical protein
MQEQLPAMRSSRRSTTRAKAKVVMMGASIVEASGTWLATAQWPKVDRKEVENKAVEPGEQFGDPGRKEKEKASSVAKDLEKARARKAKARTIGSLDQPTRSLRGT